MNDIPITTGLSQLDCHLRGGLLSGENGIIIARPGVGMTTMLTNLAVSAAAIGHHVLCINTEMRPASFRHRVIGPAAYLLPATLARPVGTWSAAERERLDAVYQQGYKGRITIADMSVHRKPTLDDVEHAIHTWLACKENEGVRDRASLVLLDEIGSVHPAGQPVNSTATMEWQVRGGVMKDWTRLIRSCELASWTVAPATLDAEGVRIIKKQHTALASQMLWPVDVAIGLGPDVPQPCWRPDPGQPDPAQKLYMHIMKARGGDGIICTCYRDATLRLYNRRMEAEHHKCIVDSGDLAALMPFGS